MWVGILLITYCFALVLVIGGEDGSGNASQPLLSLFWSMVLHPGCLELLKECGSGILFLLSSLL